MACYLYVSMTRSIYTQTAYLNVFTVEVAEFSVEHLGRPQRHRTINGSVYQVKRWQTVGESNVFRLQAFERDAFCVFYCCLLIEGTSENCIQTNYTLNYF